MHLKCESIEPHPNCSHLKEVHRLWSIGPQTDDHKEQFAHYNRPSIVVTCKDFATQTKIVLRNKGTPSSDDLTASETHPSDLDTLAFSPYMKQGLPCTECETLVQICGELLSFSPNANGHQRSMRSFLNHRATMGRSLLMILANNKT